MRKNVPILPAPRLKATAAFYCKLLILIDKLKGRSATHRWTLEKLAQGKILTNASSWFEDKSKAAIEKGELPALAPGAMAYMLSKQGFLNSKCGNCSPHLMFYVSVKDAHTWGAGALSPDLPVLLAPRFNGASEPVTEFIVEVSEWSDGTPASDPTPAIHRSSSLTSAFQVIAVRRNCGRRQERRRRKRITRLSWKKLQVRNS